VAAGSPEVSFQPLQYLPAVKNQYGRKKWIGTDRAAKVGPVDKYVIAAGDTLNVKLRFCFIIIIIIIIIGKDTISFMQGIYTYIPETDYVPKEYNVAAIIIIIVGRVAQSV
jgi:hypothetical protein